MRAVSIVTCTFTTLNIPHTKCYVERQPVLEENYLPGNKEVPHLNFRSHIGKFSLEEPSMLTNLPYPYSLYTYF